MSEIKKSNSRTISKQENLYKQYFNAKNQTQKMKIFNDSGYQNFKIFNSEGVQNRSQEKYSNQRRVQAESFQAKLMQNKTMYNANAGKQIGRNFGARVAKIEQFGSADNPRNRLVLDQIKH